MTTDFRALCAELVDDLELCDWPYTLKETIRADIERACVALAEPEPEGPTLDDIWELCEEHGFVLGIDGAHEDESAEGLLSIARAVLARWGRPTPQPVPVSERLPEPGDCLDEGWAWFFYPRIGWRQAVPPVTAAYTHWLPAHAIPLPDASD